MFTSLPRSPSPVPSSQLAPTPPSMSATGPSGHSPRASRFGPVPRTATTLGVAMSAAQVLQAWNLVYRVYLKRGYIRPNPRRLHAAAPMFTRQAAVLVKSRGQEVLGTLSVAIDGGMGLPMDSTFGRELDALRRRRRRLAEVAHFADAVELTDTGRSDRASLEFLMGLAYRYALWAGADELVVGVHPDHAGFYQKLWGFEPYGPTQSCAAVGGRPAVLLRLDWRAALISPARPAMLLRAHRRSIPAKAFSDRFCFDRGDCPLTGDVAA